MNDQLNYPHLIDQAMRGVVRDVLKRVSATGLPGEHHFFISFSTNYPGVRISDTLKSRYPNEITIVLQHQFWDFKVEEHQFQVTLSFGGVPEKLVVPFAGLTAFADPSIKFGLQFQASETAEMEFVAADTLGAELSGAMHENASEEGDKIISLDAFRKK